MNPIYKLRHKIQMLKDFLQLLSTGPVTHSMGTEILRGHTLSRWEHYPFLKERHPVFESAQSFYFLSIKTNLFSYFDNTFGGKLKPW